MKHFYNDTGNLSSYFRILNLDTSQCSRQKHKGELSVKVKIGNANSTITFPHIESYDYEKSGDFTKIKVHNYQELFGKF